MSTENEKQESENHSMQKSFFNWGRHCEGVFYAISSILILSLLSQFFTSIKNHGLKLVLNLNDFYYALASEISTLSLCTVVTQTLFIFLVVGIITSSFNSILSCLKMKHNDCSENIEQPCCARKNIVSHKQVAKKFMIIIFVNIILSIVFLFFIFFGLILPAMEKAKFDRIMTGIAPFVKNEEVLNLQSLWVRMKSKKDYLAILERIKSIESDTSFRINL